MIEVSLRIRSMPVVKGQFHSDQPTFDDDLGHARHVENVAALICECTPPFVLGIHGDWGSGKSSFLQKLRLYLAGNRSGVAKANDVGKKLWPKTYKGTGFEQLETIWFEAWRYQFETTPAVALLNEIRAQLTLARSLIGEAGKITYAALMSLEELTKKIGIQPSKIVEGGEKWERDRLEQPLPSQLCRDLLEHAIETILGGGKDRRLVVFIDDLDRCKGDIALRLLEAMKIYMAISNCIFVLALDLNNVQRAVAAELGRGSLLDGGATTVLIPEIHAADYMSKIIQASYPLPLCSKPQDYLKSLLTTDVFVDPTTETLDTPNPDVWVAKILEHKLAPPNPRKIKAYVNGLAMYLSQLLPILRASEKLHGLDMELALIVSYLKLRSTGIYRILESYPEFWDRLVGFCQSGRESLHPAFQGRRFLDIPKDDPTKNPATFSYDPAFRDPADETVFRAARLIREWRAGSPPTDDEYTAYFLLTE
jgi:KAP-like P-loop domain-containing protein